MDENGFSAIESVKLSMCSAEIVSFDCLHSLLFFLVGDKQEFFRDFCWNEIEKKKEEKQFLSSSKIVKDYRESANESLNWQQILMNWTFVFVNFFVCLFRFVKLFPFFERIETSSKQGRFVAWNSVLIVIKTKVWSSESNWTRERADSNVYVCFVHFAGRPITR